MSLNLLLKPSYIEQASAYLMTYQKMAQKHVYPVR